MTQNEMILKHLQEVGNITPMEALSEYGCMRLASRISDLKKQGVMIGSRTISHRNRFGKQTSYSKYYLIEE